MKQEVETLRRERDELAKHNAELKQRVSALHKWADEWKRRTNFLRSWMLGRSFPHHSEFVTQWHEFLQDFPEAAEWFASPKWFEEEE
ncbi:MAG: hypothetical protein K0U84_13480 [Actinomycetia bacterium]|nr:hypothetical protein [Actinomycetes bacterium]